MQESDNFHFYCLEKNAVKVFNRATYDVHLWLIESLRAKRNRKSAISYQRG